MYFGVCILEKSVLLILIQEWLKKLSQSSDLNPSPVSVESQRRDNFTQNKRRKKKCVLSNLCILFHFCCVIFFPLSSKSLIGIEIWHSGIAKYFTCFVAKKAKEVVLVSGSPKIMYCIFFIKIFDGIFHKYHHWKTMIR